MNLPIFILASSGEAAHWSDYTSCPEPPPIVSPLGDGQHFPQFNRNNFINRHNTNLAALALDDDGVFPERLLRSGRVNAEALMDTQSSVLGQAGDGGKVLVAVRHTGRQKPVALPDAPGTVCLAKAPALQLHRQFVFRGQAVFCTLHFVMEKTDGSQTRGIYRTAAWPRSIAPWYENCPFGCARRSCPTAR